MQFISTLQLPFQFEAARLQADLASLLSDAWNSFIFLAIRFDLLYNGTVPGFSTISNNFGQLSTLRECMPKSYSLEDLTKESFDSHLGSVFELTLESTVITLELTDVNALGEPAARSWGKKKALTSRQPFSLVFLGPSDPVFQQGAFPISHPVMGEFGNVFLVAIGQDDDGRYYEAVFA